MRHPFHSLCPYFAMFPEDFAREIILKYTQQGDWVFDPFSGRGTTVFESLLWGRRAAGTDINPVAACISAAKADPPNLDELLKRVAQLEKSYRAPKQIPLSEFFQRCFHETTLRQIIYLRASLKWRSSKTDRFIASLLLGALHGESHKTPNCLSNRMPRTISTKPVYSVKWWRKRKLFPPERNCFDILRTIIGQRYGVSCERGTGKVLLADARKADKRFPELRGKVKLIVTSPPYINTTAYTEDQWLRLWFLGGAAKPSRRNTDDRHTNHGFYWNFLSETWNGVLPLLKKRGILVVRIGGASKETLRQGLLASLKKSTRRSIRAINSGQTSVMKNRQTNVFRPGTNPRRVEHDFAFRFN